MEEIKMNHGINSPFSSPQKIPQHSTPMKNSKNQAKYLSDTVPTKIHSKSAIETPVTSDSSKFQTFDNGSSDGGNVAWKQKQAQLFSEFESKTIQKQRQELQLLIIELKSRDQELNDMVAAHQKQLVAWEHDRQKILKLEEKNSELQKENEVVKEEVRQLKARQRVLESEQLNKSTALESVQDQLARITEDNSQIERELHDLQEHSRYINSTSEKLNSRIGELEAKEQEFLHVLQSKDRDLSDAASRIAELNAKLKAMATEVEQLRQSERELRNQMSEWKKKCGEEERDKDLARKQQAKGEELLQEQNVEIQKLRQELVASKREILVVADREKRKDQLLDLQRSKQERTELELANMRQLYERQQQDLTLLHLNLESSRDLLDKYQKGFFTDRYRRTDYSSDHDVGNAVSKSPKMRGANSSIKRDYNYSAVSPVSRLPDHESWNRSSSPSKLQSSPHTPFNIENQVHDSSMSYFKGNNFNRNEYETDDRRDRRGERNIIKLYKAERETSENVVHKHNHGPTREVETSERDFGHRSNHSPTREAEKAYRSYNNSAREAEVNVINNQQEVNVTNNQYQTINNRTIEQGRNYSENEKRTDWQYYKEEIEQHKQEKGHEEGNSQDIKRNPVTSNQRKEEIVEDEVSTNGDVDRQSVRSGYSVRSVRSAAVREGDKVEPLLLPSSSTNSSLRSSSLSLIMSESVNNNGSTQPSVRQTFSGRYMPGYEEKRTSQHATGDEEQQTREKQSTERLAESNNKGKTISDETEKGTRKELNGHKIGKVEREVSQSVPTSAHATPRDNATPPERTASCMTVIMSNDARCSTPLQGLTNAKFSKKYVAQSVSKEEEEGGVDGKRCNTPQTQLQKLKVEERSLTESPATKLHKVLRESKEIVDSLDRLSNNSDALNNSSVMGDMEDDVE